eukprot:gene41273-55820_t
MAVVADTSGDSSLMVKLAYKEKIPVATMKDIIKQVLNEKMASLVSYEGDKCNETARNMADTIKSRLKHCGYDRYKYVVQVIIGERREQGVRMGSRCFWDSNTDNQASEYITNDHVFCTATAYAIYLY